MAKKERLRLVMANDTVVTDLQSLKEHFDWEKALQYYKTGELLEWLRRLYLDEEADALEKLDSRSADFPKEFCALFGVEYKSDKPYIPPSTTRTRATAGQRRKAPTPPPRPAAMPRTEPSIVPPSSPVTSVPDNIVDAGADFDLGEAFDSGIMEETLVEETPLATSTAEKLPEIAEASPVPLAQPSEPVSAMPLPPSEPPTDASPTSAPQSSNPSNSSGLGAIVGCVLLIVVIVGVVWGAWSIISSLWSSFDSKKEKTEPPTKIEQQQKQEEKTAAPIENPREASIRTFRTYHENITKHDFQQAYDCFDQEMQEFINYDNWVSGHQTTVKSNPYDIKVVSESPEKVVLTYTLQTVDTPGGEKVFDGKAVIIKTENGWKINDVENVLKQPTTSAPQKQETPSAPPTPNPEPTPAAPPAPPAKPEIAYRTFTENWYGFSFEYPASEGDFPQADSNGGERAVEYWIDFPNGKVLMGAEFAWHDATEADMRYVADDKHSNDFEMLGANSYIVRWRNGNETVTRKTFMVPNHRKGSSGFVRQYIEIRQRGKLSPENQDVAQHMMDSFQPGD